jgi:ureidoglycolate lyase
MKLSIQELTPASFEQYGAVIEQPTRPNDAGGPGWQWWGELVQMEGGERPYAIGFLDLKPDNSRFTWAERHIQTDELLVPLTGDCLVYVAPPEYPAEPDRLPALDHFQVFRVRQGQAVLLKKGVWHGAPLAGNEPARVLVILQYQTGNQDMHLARFEESPVEIET